jgi:phage gp45-like
MKTNLIAIFTVIVTVLGITNSTYAAVDNNNNKGVVLTDISNINKIEIYGNVQVYVSTGTDDQVKVYNRYYAESALVQSQKGVLRISSYKTEKLVVWVTAKQLSAITAYDNAEVKSFGNLSAIELDVKLYNNASADLKLDAYSTRLTMNDHAKANLSGNVSEYSQVRNIASSVNTTYLLTETATDKLTGAPAKAAEYAGI